MTISVTFHAKEAAMRGSDTRLLPSLVAVVACATFAGCAGITAVGPQQGIPGTVVEIRGRGFSPLWFMSSFFDSTHCARLLNQRHE
jgi:hypothetical protein